RLPARQHESWATEELMKLLTIGQRPRFSLWRLFISLVLLPILFVGILHCRKSEIKRTVKIGYLPIYVDLPLFVAKEQGFFQKHGVDVQTVRFAASPEIGTAL